MSEGRVWKDTDGIGKFKWVNDPNFQPVQLPSEAIIVSRRMAESVRFMKFILRGVDINPDRKEILEMVEYSINALQAIKSQLTEQC